MERFFWVKWKNSKEEEYVVGILASVEGRYYFQYNTEFKNENYIPEGFNSIPSFGRVRNLTNEEKEYTFALRSAGHLFDFFKMRIPAESDKSEWKGIVENYDEDELLAKTRGISATDSFSVVEMDEQAVKDVKHYGLIGVDEIENDIMSR
ncbi:MAG: hypothetical protein IJS47_04375 [Clostridia bacterium]|nr:hypothetical protein [Clostridia bacterium]